MHSVRGCKRFKFKLQIIHAMKHLSRCVRWSYASHPRSELRPAQKYFILTHCFKIFQHSAWTLLYIWSFYEKQMPATRTLLQAETPQGRGSYKAEMQTPPSQDIE